MMADWEEAAGSDEALSDCWALNAIGPRAAKAHPPVINRVISRNHDIRPRSCTEVVVLSTKTGVFSRPGPRLAVLVSREVQG
jgi:hypothetical protein